jgi:NAD(P)-dependent dehydrogenase (short-subunit alcohol dehydrogenase family)
MRLQGKVALVTGATYGIGTTIVERLAEEGASVVFTGRSGDKGSALQDEFRARGLTVSFCQGSAADEADVARAVATTVAAYGTITTVVNNAAATDVTRPGGGDSHVIDIENDAFDAVLRVGVYGVLWSSKYALPIEGRPAYQASKGAVNALTRQMAVDYGPLGIRSNAIVVGFTPTGGEVITKMVQNESFISAVKQAIPSNRLGHPRDIANGCVYLASDEGEYVNGVLLPIDGGFTCKLLIPDTSALSSIGEG